MLDTQSVAVVIIISAMGVITCIVNMCCQILKQEQEQEQEPTDGSMNENGASASSDLVSEYEQ